MTHISKIVQFAGLGLLLASCTKDLNRKPLVGTTSDNVYNTPADYKEGLAKVYAGFAVTGQQGPSGEPDVSGIDEGSSDYLRSYWSLQEWPTDEAVCHWEDPGQSESAFHQFSWTSSNTTIITGFYDRIFYEVGIANEFIRQSADGIITGKGFAETDVNNVQGYRYEARFLRALSYYHAIDLYGSVPFVTENDVVGAFLPKQVSRDSLFNYVESELLALQSLLPAPGQNEYGRADQGAVWMLLAKLYLNAKVYTGTDRSTDCITYCNKIISSGKYSLAANYAWLFLTDSHTTSNEIIFPIRMNGQHIQSYGSTNFIIHGAIGGSMNASAFGVNGGWGGNTTTSALVAKFDTVHDKRAMFYTDGQSLDIPAITSNVFTYGYAITKFKNISSTGAPGSDPSGNYVDTDYPMFRLADVYLMYAESVLRSGSGGDMGTALQYVNALRERAYGNKSADLSSIALGDILDERGRELYWEGSRRTDLIRYGYFTGDGYLWPWKGNVAGGTGVDSHYNLYPIPYTDITANPTITQNPGYQN